MLPSVAFALRCAASLATVHSAAARVLDRGGLASRAQARHGQASRGRWQLHRLQLHGVVRRILHFGAPGVMVELIGNDGLPVERVEQPPKTRS